MSALVKAIQYHGYAVKACGRACADMEPTTLPQLPLKLAPSLAAMQREYPGMEVDPEWLEGLPTSDTIH
jgi:hypothetical protein